MTSVMGYADPICLAPGETVNVMVSCEGAPSYRADIVRLLCPDTRPEGPGFQEEVIETVANGTYPARRQEINAGSYAVVPDLGGFDGAAGFTVTAMILRGFLRGVPRDATHRPQYFRATLQHHRRDGRERGLSGEHAGTQADRGGVRLGQDDRWHGQDPASRARQGRLAVHLRPRRLQPDPIAQAVRGGADVITPGLCPNHPQHAMTTAKGPRHGPRHLCPEHRNHGDGRIDAELGTSSAPG